jgi:hypothetical protein
MTPVYAAFSFNDLLNPVKDDTSDAMKPKYLKCGPDKAIDGVTFQCFTMELTDLPEGVLNVDGEVDKALDNILASFKSGDYDSLDNFEKYIMSFLPKFLSRAMWVEAQQFTATVTADVKKKAPLIKAQLRMDFSKTVYTTLLQVVHAGNASNLTKVSADVLQARLDKLDAERANFERAHEKAEQEHYTNPIDRKNYPRFLKHFAGAISNAIED